MVINPIESGAMDMPNISRHPAIIVIGAGIVGAMTAYHLARVGARVHVIEAAPAAAPGVTGRSFGWINTLNADPSEDRDVHALRRGAIVRFEALDAALGGRLLGAKRGAVIWDRDPADTEALIAGNSAFGLRIEAIDRSRIATLVPALREPPALAAWAPDHRMLHPERAARLLLDAAHAKGAAVSFNCSVRSILTEKGHVAGVDANGETLRADTVVVAAGLQSQTLLAPLGIETGLYTSPAVLTCFSASNASRLNHIVQGPNLEVRALDAKALIVAAGPPEDDNLAGLAERQLQALNRTMTGFDDAMLLSIGVGQRPRTRDGALLAGPIGDIDGLHVAAGHPGVILAPAMAQTVTEHILDRAGSIDA